jgi:hypothetical protein
VSAEKAQTACGWALSLFSSFLFPPPPLRCYPSRKEDGAFQWDYGKPWTYCRDSETYTDPTYSDSCSGCKFHPNP